VRAEINSHQFGLHSAGGAEFQAAAGRIHDLLFGGGEAEEALARAVQS
jgi:NitT/TauT family transport system ATP-binding protein